MTSSPAVEYDYTHPERTYPKLKYVPGKRLGDESGDDLRVPSEPGANVGDDDDEDIDDDGLGAKWERELCWNCGWMPRDQVCSSYASQLKMVSTRQNRGLWVVGSQWFVRDQPNDHTLGNDYMTQQFLRNQPNSGIPLVKEMRMLTQPTDKMNLTLMSRAPGVGLDSIWYTLSPEEKSSYRDQVTGILRQLRKFTAPRAQKVDGSRLDDIIIGFCDWTMPGIPCKQIGYTTNEWFENMKEELCQGLSVIHNTKDTKLLEVKYQEIKDNFPKGGPFVLTHGDLHLSNIIVQHGRIEAIIDWEYAGYYPWWAERRQCMLSDDDRTRELFGPLWETYDTEKNQETYQTEVMERVGDAYHAWSRCRTEHIDEDEGWERPPFCKCRPYTGKFRACFLGKKREHSINRKEFPSESDSVDRLSKNIMATIDRISGV